MVHTRKMCQQETQSGLFLFYVVFVVKGHTHIWSEMSKSLNWYRMRSGLDRVRKTLYFSWNWQNNELNAEGALTWQADGTNIICCRIIHLQPWTLTIDYSVKKRDGWLVGFFFVSQPRGQNVIFMYVRKLVYSLKRSDPVYSD